MNTLLLLHTSLQGSDSLSSSLASDYVSRWRTSHPQGNVVSRDLAADPVPHLTAERFEALTRAAGERSPGQQAVAEFSDELIAELEDADEILIALPMHNFGVPSTFKAYIDHIARAGVTFRYTQDGPVGLLGNKRAIVIATRGGVYEGTPIDTQTDFVKNVLAFLGIEDTQFVYAEGIAMGEDSVKAGIKNARQQIRALDEALAA